MNGYEGLRTAAALLDVSARGKIRVVGEDRARLLHAMTTNHVQNLKAGEGLYAFFLNDKGRILADASIYNLGDSLFLDTEPELRAKLFEHLDRFIIADDVTLEDEAESLAALSIEGPSSLDRAAELEIPVSDATLGVAAFSDGFTARVSLTGAPGVRIFLPLERKTELMERLQTAGIPLATEEEIKIARLENGTPRYGEDITERYLVQETQIMRAVHDNKGCYLGQEIVERVRARGQVHRLLTPLRLAGTAAPQPGVKLTANQAVVGEISSAAFSPALGEVVALGYIRAEALAAKPPMTVEGSEPPIPAFLR